MPFISDLSKTTIETVLKQYGLHKINSFREFPLGIQNVNIKAETEKGVFVLRQWVEAQTNNIAFELSMLNELRKQNFPVPKVFKARNGKEIVEFRGKHFALLEFMPGKYLKNSELNSQQLWEMGRMLAEMQLALKKFKPRGKSKTKDLFHFEQDYDILKNAFPIVGRENQRVLEELKKEVQKLEPKLRQLGRELRMGPIHNDLFHWNIKFKGNKISAVLDFGDACIGTWASDIATTLMETAYTKNKIYPTRIKKIMEGYQTKIQLKQNEIKTLPHLMWHRALQTPLGEIKAMTKQQKNKKLYKKWLKKDWPETKKIKKQLQKIKKTLNNCYG